MSNIFTSSIGKKLLMSLLGLFLISFLVVHLGINLLVLKDGTESFNKAANFMGTNPVIRVFEVVLFLGFLLHMLYGVILSIKNMLSRPVGYKVSNNSQSSFFSKYMFHTALVVTAFLVLHLFDFWVKAKVLHTVPGIDTNGLKDLGALVIARFQILWVVVFYEIALLFLGFHLWHGFQSAFQTIGVNHPVYTPVIKSFGVLYTLLVTAGFMIIPIVIYFTK
ncbi:MAG TPA: succinate dehydrogenase [Bacteroidales bacterium]|jgi:succinate dehydrogenase / fumarate reductase cytochrome b subunit|nr:succinate dehydrogenase [Bacteroidales bacterium]